MGPKPILKRKAQSQPATKSKKIHLDKAEKPEKKRSRPVTATLPPPEASGTDSEDDDEDQAADDEEDEWDGVDDDGDVEMENESPQNATKPAKDPNAARESHKAQKALLQERKAAKPHSNLLAEAKRIWALARKKDIKPAERQKHVQELMSTIRGKVKEIVFKHDASRIVQTIVKYGGQKERDEIASELKGRFRELAQNKYSKFLVTKLIRFCSSQRQSILLEFQPQVLRLLLHREATSVLADAFELYANAYERSILLREFYGKEATLFTITSGSEEDKEKARKGLNGYLEGVDVERKRRIIRSVKENLTTVFNNPDKGAVTHAIIHRVLWEYLQALNSLPEEEEREKLRREMFETCQEVLAEMVHTKDGSRVVREFLACGTAKDRKQILKVLKPHIERMCLDDEAQLVLFTALDVTDDTKLLAKSIVSEIVNSAEKLYTTVQGRRALLYLIVPRSRRHFTPAQIASLAETDETRSRTSKKSPENRESEIRTSASEGLISWVQEEASTLIRDPGASLVVTDIMLNAEGDKSSAIASLLSAITIPYPPDEISKDAHPIDLAHTSRLYKTLLQGGHYNHKTQSIEPARDWKPAAFAVQFVNTLGKDLVVAMCTKGEQNGCFVVAELCQALVSGDEKEARKSVKEWFTKEVRKTVEDSEARGKKVLLEKLELL
ncbi:puf family RNA-binding protein [Coprinopsis cinerea okayama7|uniref:Puf family RNA-binding protein n=1 Tax=Coprinopsis cinerea (strain Okayama-7 / 130 / ATCC MYA-4618 / FGSC 9003) TaxID=240176 RepID=A8NLI2_COPC7|nr:puf family RNA-binding protein [Coprinopsis cinerea okayama7\|eukprot:XP_001834693.1 puf family RNA-binding protein [Coprinopsis cinerea okayama7\